MWFLFNFIVVTHMFRSDSLIGLLYKNGLHLQLHDLAVITNCCIHYIICVPYHLLFYWIFIVRFLCTMLYYIELQLDTFVSIRPFN